MTSLAITFTAGQLQALDQASTPDAAHPYGIFSDDVNRMTFGGATMRGWGHQPR